MNALIQSRFRHLMKRREEALFRIRHTDGQPHQLKHINQNIFDVIADCEYLFKRWTPDRVKYQHHSAFLQRPSKGDEKKGE